MSKRIEVAQGYVTIIPSLRGAQQRIASELTPAAVSAGKSAGEAIEKGVAQGARRGAKDAGESIASEVPKAGDTAGKEAGERLASGMRSPISKASDQIAKDVQAKLGNAFKGMGDKIGGSVGGAFSGIKGFWGDALADVGGQIKGSKLGQAFSGVASGAKSAFASATGTVKGFAGFMGSALKGVAGKVGPAFAVIGTAASTAFSGIKSVVGNVVSHVTSAFKGIAEKLKGPLSAIGDAASTAFKGLAAGAAAAGAAVIAVGKQAFDGFAEYEQLVGGMDTLFGTASNKMQIYAHDAYKTAQMSANDYMSLTTSFAASLLQSLGGDTNAAADAANQAVIDMADNANKMGTSMEDIENAYKGFSKQNYTMLDNLNNMGALAA